MTEERLKEVEIRLAVLIEHVEGLEKGVQLNAREFERRLVALNALREDFTRAQGVFLTKEQYDVQHETLRLRIERAEQLHAELVASADRAHANFITREEVDSRITTARGLSVDEQKVLRTRLEELERSHVSEAGQRQQQQRIVQRMYALAGLLIAAIGLLIALVAEH